MNEPDIDALTGLPLRPEEVPEPGPLLTQLGIEQLQRRQPGAPQLDVSPLSLQLMQLRGLA